MNDTITPPRLAPQQRDLKPGSFWMKPVDGKTDFMYFGRVPTRTEVRDRAKGTRMDPGVLIDLLETGLVRNMLHSEVYSRFNADGTNENVHRSEVWPLSAALFGQLRRAGFDPRSLLNRSEYQRVVAEMMAWFNGGPSPRRPFADFLREAEQIARISVAAHPGQHYISYARCGDREIVMWFDSQEARFFAATSMERHRFHVKHLGEPGSKTLSLRDHSEEPYPASEVVA